MAKCLLAQFLTVLGLLLQVSQGETNLECSSRRAELGDCLKSMSMEIVEQFTEAKLTNFLNPTQEEKDRMEHIATEELCNTDAKQFVDCTIRILRACPSLINGNEMNSTAVSKDIRKFQWYHYPDANSLCVCYKARSCLDDTKELLRPLFKANRERGDTMDWSTQQMAALLFLGKNLCRDPERVKCAQQATMKAGCATFITPRTSRHLAADHEYNPLLTYIDTYCTSEMLASYEKVYPCFTNQSDGTDECLHQKGVRLLEDETGVVQCGVKYSTATQCFSDGIGVYCGAQWSEFFNLLAHIQGTKDSECALADSGMVHNARIRAQVILGLIVTMAFRANLF